jgi:hypothetical protein
MTKCHNSIHSVMLHSCWFPALGPGFRDNLAHGNVKVSQSSQSTRTSQKEMIGQVVKFRWFTMVSHAV